MQTAGKEFSDVDIDRSAAASRFFFGELHSTTRHLFDVVVVAAHERFDDLAPAKQLVGLDEPPMEAVLPSPKATGQGRDVLGELVGRPAARNRAIEKRSGLRTTAAAGKDRKDVVLD